MKFSRGRMLRDWSDDWLTPDWLLEKVRLAFGGRIDLDPCSHPDDHVNAKRRVFWPRESGLDVFWHGRVFVNPPFGRGIEKWYHKAWVSGRCGAQVLLLIPVWTDSIGFQFYAPRSDAICFIRGRLNFINPAKHVPFGATNSHAMIAYGLTVQEFMRGFGDVGWVIRPRLQTSKVVK